MKKTVKKTTARNDSSDLLSLKEEVRALKRKLWVAERMRFETVSQSTSAAKKKEAWDGKLLAAGVAHEFNNILGAADGHAEWALQTGLPQDMKEALQVVRQACRRSLQITKSLQALPTLREEAAGVFALSKVANDLKLHFRPLSKKTQIRVDIEMPPGDIYGSESELFEVLVNLIKNAIEALQSKKSVAGARVECVGRLVGPDRVKILVSDNGPGIPEALRERIFHPFFTTKGRMKEMLKNSSDEHLVATSAAPTSSEGGSGLGLFLSRSIIQKMGGRLEYVPVASGTRFQVALPLASKPRRPSVTKKT